MQNETQKEYERLYHFQKIASNYQMQLSGALRSHSTYSERRLYTNSNKRYTTQD
jgi:hypothetical protein